jgi:hypothetical protein|uniref:Uncharacterized protein n=1 Tax=Desulfobacca acetoxidans TaxID=60893 RepID=A0A7V6A3E6_9BACT
MAPEPAKKGEQMLSGILHCVKTFIVNSYRRLLIVGHYGVICFHQQCLRRTWRHLGRSLHQAVAAGEDNPLLSEAVQENLNQAEVIKGAKERHYQAIALLREKIKTCRQESPAAAEAASQTEAGKEDVERETGV